MAEFTLDDAHEALGLVSWYSRNSLCWHPLLDQALGLALDAIEAQLPEPCENCGDDSCPWLITTSPPGVACAHAEEAMWR
jgi:hypothetical protein